jgi:hypothetical protein
MIADLSLKCGGNALLLATLRVGVNAVAAPPDEPIGQVCALAKKS